MRIYRFQGTKEIETRSYFEDIMDIWYRKNEYLEDTEGGNNIPADILEGLYEEYEHSLSYRTDIDTRSLFDKIIDCSSEDKAWEIAQTYKMNGVFAISADEWDKKHTIEELIKASKNPELGLKNNYLVEANADYIEYLGKDYGYLVNLIDIINIYEVPAELIE